MSIETETLDPQTVVTPAGDYVMDTDHSALIASVRHSGISNYMVRFYRIKGDLYLEPENIGASRIAIEIDPKSVRAGPVDSYKDYFPDNGFETWDEELGSRPGLLGGLKFPVIKFVSETVEKTGDYTARIEGKLSFLGLSKPVILNATYSGGLEKHAFYDCAVVAFSAEGTFNRSDFGMDDIGIEDKTTIRFDGQFLQKVEQQS